MAASPFNWGRLRNHALFSLFDGDERAGPIYRAREYPPQALFEVWGTTFGEGGLVYGLRSSYSLSSVWGHRAQVDYLGQHIGRHLESFTLDGAGGWPFLTYLGAEDRVRVHWTSRHLHGMLRDRVATYVASAPRCQRCPDGCPAASFQCDLCLHWRCEACIAVAICPRIWDGEDQPEALELCWRYRGDQVRFCRPAPHYPFGLQTTLNGLPVDGRYVG